MRKLTGIFIMALSGMFGAACGTSGAAQQGGKTLPEPKETIDRDKDKGVAVFAGGCFWCVEAVFERIEGVSEAVSGYAGGDQATADYETVSAGETQHAEVVRITYDPQKVSYTELLRVFFATHDPTQKNRQGPDWGAQYRSAVFYADEHQQRAAKAYVAQLDEAKIFDKPIATTLEPLDGFYTAEQYHQDFVKKHPRHPYVQQWAVPKLQKLEKQFGDELKDSEQSSSSAQ